MPRRKHPSLRKRCYRRRTRARRVGGDIDSVNKILALGKNNASHYDVLGISETATQEEIRKAYKRLALALHPDKNSGNETNAKAAFIELAKSYSTLNDPATRQMYDRNPSRNIDVDISQEMSEYTEGMAEYADMYSSMSSDPSQRTRAWQTEFYNKDTPGRAETQVEQQMRENREHKEYAEKFMRDLPERGAYTKPNHNDARIREEREREAVINRAADKEAEQEKVRQGELWKERKEKERLAKEPRKGWLWGGVSGGKSRKHRGSRRARPRKSAARKSRV